MANLKLKNVNKIYPSGVLALYKVNLELSDSEFVAVVGAEKSGKSTLLRVIAGLEEITEGEIYIGDKDVSAVEPKDRDVAMIFRNNTLYPALNVYENIAFGLKLRKASSAVVEQRVKAAADILGLSDVLYRKPKTLTSEQKQKVVFARAIVREPKLYLLDDPLSGLDENLKANMRNVVINLQARMNGTFIYATKNVNEALTMATRIIVLREGVVQQIDTPANLYDYPANAYVAFLVGSPTINFINNAVIEREDGEVYVSFKGGKLKLPENIIARFTDLEEYVSSGKKVIAGLRPEDLKVEKEGQFKAVVSSAEEIAGRNYVDCQAVGDLSLVLAAEGAQKSDNLSICADLSHIYLFDSETRFNLLKRDEGYVKTPYADADAAPLPYNEEEEIKKKISQPVDNKKKKK